MADHKNLVARLVDYAGNTTIHGIKYLSEKQRPFIEKIFWIVIFVVSLLVFGFFVKDIFNKFNQKSAILVEDEQQTPIYSIPFPAVTICPTVKIKTEYFSSGDMLKWLSGRSINGMITDWAELICNPRLLFGSTFEKDKRHFNLSYIKLLHDISPTIEDSFFIIAFDMKNEINNSTMEQFKLTNPIAYILTNEGICYTFNVPSEIINDDPTLQTEYPYHNIQNKSESWHNEYGYSGYPRFPRSVRGSGLENGLSLTMTADIDDLYTFCQPTQIGYKIILHSPDEYPTTFEKFISIPYNTMTQIKVTPKITKTSYDLWYLNPQVRQCFFSHERQLKYFTYYNRVNCKLECLANFTMQQYGCVHFSLPRNNSQPICGTNIKINQMYDTEENINSYLQFKKTVIDKYEPDIIHDSEPTLLKNISNFNCNCLPACNSLEYKYTVDIEDMKLDKLQLKYSPEMANKTDTLVAIDIFFDLTKVTGSTRKRLYTFTDLVSNIGGLVGLFLGASILSIFEIIYFISIR